MIKTHHKAFGFITTFLILIILMPAIASADWSVEIADVSKKFNIFSSRAIAIDTVTNQPHIAYGRQQLYYAWSDGTQWHYETVDSALGVGPYASIAIDSNSKAHISYYDGTKDDLKYATNASGTWVISTIDSDGDVGYYTSLALDSNNRVHISYNDKTNGELKYATNSSGAWITLTIAQAGDGIYTSIALDSNNNVHIACYDNISSDLKYVTNAPGAWVTSTIDSTGFVGRFASIAIDSNNRVHISYYDSSYDSLKYATDTSGTWVISTVYSYTYATPYNSIAVDSNNKAHITYYENMDRDLAYATNASGSWVTLTVDSAGVVGLYPSVALDSNNRVHISYYDNINSDLKYATNTTGTWITSITDSTEDLGSYTSLAVDLNSSVHISYYDRENGDLKYATNASGAWSASIIDSTGVVGQNSSLAVDANNKVHISYFDESTYSLKYATNASGTWILSFIDMIYAGENNSLVLDANNKAHISYQTNPSGGSVGALKYATNVSGLWETFAVDSSGDIDEFTSIAVDSNNGAHISYYDSTNDDLRYATNISGSWVTSTIDSGGNVGMYSSIAVDNSDSVHISYYDDTNADLKYATDGSGTWVASTIDSILLSGRFSSIAVDSNDMVHISYLDSTNNDLRYATDKSGTWALSTIDSADLVGYYTSIAVDLNNLVHISYKDDTLDLLKYVSIFPGSNITVSPASIVFSTINVGSVSEQIITVQNNGDENLIIGNIEQGSPADSPFSIRSDSCSGLTFPPGTGCTVTVEFEAVSAGSFSDTLVIPSNDSNENPVIINLDGTAYGPAGWTTELVSSTSTSLSLGTDLTHKAHIASYNNGLLYTTNKDFFWKTRKVSSSYYQYGISLVMDAADNVHMCYYATYVTNKSGQWETESIASGSTCSIALDMFDNVHMIYRTYLGEVKYATNASGVWISELVSSYDRYTDSILSIVVDFSGKVHIGRGSTSQDSILEYITNETGTWETIQLDSGGTKIIPSIDIDSSGKVHIAYNKYYGSSVGVSDLSYATNLSGLWSIIILDSATPIIDPLTIDLNSSDELFIGFRDSSNGHLKYFTDKTGVWNVETLIHEFTERYFSFDIDSLDNMHIAFSLNGVNYMTNAPVPDIQANGSDSPVTVNHNDPVSITIELAPNASLGSNAESWILADTNSGWYSYDKSSQNWLPGQAVYDQGALSELGPVEILTQGLPSGHHRYYYIVDFMVNGYMDITDSYSDSVEVHRTENDWYAVDMTHAPSVAAISVEDESLPDLTASEFTIETWLNGRRDVLNGSIFNRFYYMGAALYVENNEPKLMIGHSTTHSTSTSSQFVVGSNTSILKNIWTHIAGILVNQDHQSIHASCDGAEAESPHMDIYINGEFKNCASTGSEFADNRPYDNNKIIMGADYKLIYPYVQYPKEFEGALDEIRFWSVARTQTEIQQCMTQELNNSGGVCDNDPSILKGYWRFNEGSGSVVNDSSGHGYDGVKKLESSGAPPWDGGWIPGYHYSADEDGDGVPANQDCDDRDPLEYPGQTWYQDLDNDGYSDGTVNSLSCERPLGFKLDSELYSISVDCDDYDTLEHPDQIWYLDGDNDGYSDGTINDSSCERLVGYKVVSELINIAGDCDDSNAALSPETLWYSDNDGDGFGDPFEYVQQCSQSLDYVLNNRDCDDSDANLYFGGPQVRITGSPHSYFETFQEAYLAASWTETDHIQTKGTRPEDLLFNLNKTVIMDGGYDCSFTKTGRTIVYGTVEITDGVVTMGDYDLR